MEQTSSIENPYLMDKGKLLLKAVFIFFMALGLWIPTIFIMGLVKEREGRQKEAIADISNKWAGRQTITGPVLRIPYTEYVKNEKGITMQVKKLSYFIPDNIDAKAVIFPEKRHRGIYQVIVYRSDVELKGKFKPLQWQLLKIPQENFVWSEAALIFQVSDQLRGINEDLTIKWNDSTAVFNPQPAGDSPQEDAFFTPLVFSAEDKDKEHVFSMKFSLNGSEQILFASAARENKLEMHSSWPDPSFTGIKLPDTRNVKDSGFVAHWKFMNRAVPAAWNNHFYDLTETAMGADLIIPMDSYNKTERSVKYALLCIVLTFAAFFLIESIYKKPLHLVQYGLAGLALVLFYTLLLSISEYTGFNIAYMIAGVATIGLVAWFVGNVMRSFSLAMFISLVLIVVYGYIFTIIQLQDYSLLMGSVGLFVALGIIMYFSRKLNLVD